MDQCLDAVRVALRVLVAVTAGRRPEPEDVEELQRWAPRSGYESVDAMACAVVDEGLKSVRTTYKQAGV